MTEKHSIIKRDRDKERNWYLDKPITHTLHNGHTLFIGAGYRFDGHSVPWIFQWLFPTADMQDIYAALIHDALLDLRPWHRYPRKFIDAEYDVIMQKISTGRRKKWMPLAVKVWGYLSSWGWTDYRGDFDKYQTKVTVKVDMVK